MAGANTQVLRPKSQALEQEWSLAAELLKDPLVTVDCSADAALCESSGSEGWPTIRLYERDGVGVNIYRGPRRAGA